MCRKNSCYQRAMRQIILGGLELFRIVYMLSTVPARDIFLVDVQETCVVDMAEIDPCVPSSYL